jgi:hypothetical protein
MPNYALRLFTPLAGTSVFVEDITQKAIGWNRSWRSMGGCWYGQFDVAGTLPDLQTWFYERLGYHVEERSGGVSWEGLVYEMDLQHQGVTRRRSLDMVANYVIAYYTDTADGLTKTTSAASDAVSIARYGRKEEIVFCDNVPQTAAEKRRDTVLKEKSWPWARPMSVNPKAGKPTLRVSVCGYVWTANWRYSTVNDGGTGNVSTWISAILADCPLLVEGTTTANTLQVVRTLRSPARAWDKIKELSELGDASGNPWDFRVETGRRTKYAARDVISPAYYLRQEGLYTSVGAAISANPWLVRPGLLRDANYPVRRQDPGAWLPDVRDMYMEQVQVSERGISFQAGNFSESGLMALQSRGGKG